MKHSEIQQIFADLRYRVLSALIWVSLMWFDLPAQGASYYVDATNGSDSNPGTISAPYQTLFRGTLLLSPGDTLYIRGGVYREILQPTRSGTAALPIVITAYSNEVVTVTGADVVTNWTSYSNGIYQATVDWDLGEARNQVLVDGEMMHQARFPNFGDGDLLHPAVTTATIGSPNNVVTSPDWAGKPANFWAGARMLGGFGSAWAHQTAIVGSSSGNSLTMSNGTMSGQWFTGSGPAYLFGLMSLLDSDKEWHLDPVADILYLRIPNGQDPNLHLVEVKRRVWTVSFANVNYVKVQGLRLRVGGVQMARGYGLALIDCDARFLSHYLKFSVGDAGDIQNAWDRGIYIASTNSVLERCTIYDTASSGVYIQGMSNVLTRNFIYNVSYTGVNGAGMNIRGRRHLITFNTISNAGWAGFAPANDSQTGHKILYNDVTRVAEVTKDTGVFYAASGSNTERTRLAYNWFHDVFPWRQSGVLIYLDGTCVNNDIDHNVLWNEIGRDAIQVASNSKNDNFFNNTIFNARPLAIGSPLIVLSNNLYLAWAPEAQLMDWQNHDFRLKPGATSIDAGIVIPGYSDGYKGAKPDLGAYETGGPYWVPGIHGWSLEQPGIRTDRARSWSGTDASVQGTLISAGTAPTTVNLYWGEADGGTNVAAWANVATVGVFATNPAVLVESINGLVPGSDYSYRFYASNAHGHYWGHTRNFKAGGGAWISDANSAWGDSTRWESGSIPNGTGTFADFSTIDITADRVIDLELSRTVGGIGFNDLIPGHSWTVSGGETLYLSTRNPMQPPVIEVQNTSVYFGAPLGGDDGLEKIGSGSLSLAAGNGYEGPTLVRGGSLLVNGSISNSPVRVAAKAVLGGAGWIAGVVTADDGSVLSPGTNGIGSAGTLTVNHLALDGATLLYNLASRTNAGAGVNDLIRLQSGGVLTLTPTNGGIVRPVTFLAHMLNGYLTNRTYMVISNASSIVGDVSTLFSAPGLSARFYTNSGAGPYHVFMAVSNVVGRDLVWRGTAGSAWNIGVTSNWLESISESASAFNQKDRVLFDDGASNFVVNVVGTLSPLSVTVENSISNYIIGGGGKITGAGSFTKSGTGTLTLNLATDYTGATRIENGTVIAGTHNVFPPNTALFLGQSDSNRHSVAALDLTSASQTVGSLGIASLRLTAMVNTSPDYVDSTRITNQIVIGAGRTLTVNGSVVIGDSALPHYLASFTSIRGAGAFNVQTAGGVFQVNGNDYPGSAGATRTYLDMSGLATANINLGNGTFYLGDRSTAGDGNSATVLTLASNTTITAGIFNIGNSQRAKPHLLKLGSGSNVFNVDTLQLGVTRDSGQVSFNTAGGTFTLRAANGSGRAALTVGPNVGTTYGASNQFMNLKDHHVDLLLSTLRVGEDNRGSSGSSYSSNYFGFSSGVLDTTALRVGNRSGNPNSTPARWFNVLDIDGGTVSIGSSGIVMGTGFGSNGPLSTNAAALNITGGTVSVGNDIVLATQNSAAGHNTLVSTLNVSGGTLVVNGDILCGIGAANPAPRLASLNLNHPDSVLNLTGHAIGGTDNISSNAIRLIDQLYFQSGTLQNVGQINGGAELVKQGAGRLTIAGNNSYTGETVVSNGTLNVSGIIGASSAVRALTDSSLTGDGLIQSPVTINGTLSPGSSVGALRINNLLTLGAGSTTLMELDSAANTNDSIRALTQVSYGGTLIVTNLSGELTDGKVFMLFEAAARSGAFDAINLPVLPEGLIWTNRLFVDGSIAITRLPLLRPFISGSRLLGTNLEITGTGGTPNGSYRVISSTNLALPLIFWTPVIESRFTPGGDFSNSIPLNPSSPSMFLQLDQ
ncbi:MAG TPA: autotransporter-associated beta strand repeat-containing protein [Verrucomicrobiae bacterium]|nr:autotransporter-associated beta strand repeat-containing protein [Verrucomicrobiae bacterium]